MSDLLRRLLRKVAPEPNSGCWLWVGADDGQDGYGRILVDGKQRSAHRVSYEIHKGPIPVGLHIDHLCRVRCCVNPDHLEAVTCGENIRRGQVGSKPKEFCKRGHRLSETANTRKDGSRYCRVCVKSAQRSAYVRKGRPSEFHHNAKLTWTDVRTLRDMWSDGKTTSEIARRFGITRGYAWRVANRKTWKTEKAT